jgi:hypothetical protein
MGFMVPEIRVARTTCCPGARSAQEAAVNVRMLGRLLVAFGHPDNKLSGLPEFLRTIVNLLYLEIPW